MLDIGFTCELLLGKHRLVYLSLVGGLCGNLLSSIMRECELDAGASTTVFVWFGFYTVVALSDLDRRYRCHFTWFLCVVVFYLVFGFVPSFMEVDPWAHLGVFIGGTTFTLIFYDGYDEVQRKRILRFKAVGIIGLCGFMIWGLVKIFTMAMPKCHERACYLDILHS